MDVWNGLGLPPLLFFTASVGALLNFKIYECNVAVEPLPSSLWISF